MRDLVGDHIPPYNDLLLLGATWGDLFNVEGRGLSWMKTVQLVRKAHNKFICILWDPLCQDKFFELLPQGERREKRLCGREWKYLSNRRL